MDRVQYESIIIQDILNLNNSGDLNTTPWYQRRSVWSRPQKAYLINTLHEQKPIPAIYIRHSLDLDKGKSIKEVVDGQQRTKAIIAYCEDEFSARHPQTGDRKIFSKLSPALRQKFLLTGISVGYLLGATDSDVIDIFGRINSVSKTLNAQEKRNSVYSGEFKQFCLSQAASRVDLLRSYNIFSANDIARMIEVQFVSDLTLNLMEGLSDFSAAKINRIYQDYDEDFLKRADLTSRLDRLFDFIVDLNRSSIRDTIFRRQPILFSLLVVLDSLKNLNAKAVEESLHAMDARFYDENNQTDEDKKFVTASTATTQRIKQRETRDKYIRRYLE